MGKFLLTKGSVMHVRHITSLALALAASLWLACGGGGGGGGGAPTSPTPTTGGTPAPATTTITIAGGTLSPAGVTIAQGGRVTVINNDSRTHEPSSDPHPNHTDCPEINQIGTLAPGQTGMTAVMNGARRCGLHDHLNPTDAALRGSITVQ